MSYLCSFQTGEATAGDTLANNEAKKDAGHLPTRPLAVFWHLPNLEMLLGVVITVRTDYRLATREKNKSRNLFHGEDSLLVSKHFCFIFR